MNAKTLITSASILMLFVLLRTASAAEPLGGSWTYQGRLNQAGAPFGGTADLDFSLWDAEVAGNQVDSTNSLLDVVVVEGVFTVDLDFGVDAFDGDARWLEISVNGTTLSPRQLLTAAPYSLHTRGLFVDDAGNLGVRTVAPNDTLEVAGSTGTGITISNGRPVFTMNDTDGVHFTIEMLNSDLRFSDDESTILSLDSAANRVGIGTITPREMLHVAGAIVSGDPGATDGEIVLEDSGTITNNPGMRTNTDGDLLLRAHSSPGGIEFETGNPESTRMVILSNGNVGIGTDAPTSEFDVVGTINATAFVGDGAGLTNLPVMDGVWHENGTDIYYNAGAVGIGTDAPAGALDVSGTVNATAFVGDGSGLTNLPVMDGVWSENGQDIYFNAGAVGIGTDAPASELDINGTATATGLLVAGASELNGDTQILTESLNGLTVEANTPLDGTIVAAALVSLTNAPQLQFAGPGLPRIDIGKNANDDFVIEFAEEVRLSVEQDGNVGIGTDAPETPLAILGNGGTNAVGITQNAVGDTSSMELTTSDSTGLQATRLLLEGGNPGDDTDIQFYTGASGAETQTMHIDGATRFVGIGTDTPATELDVAGAVTADTVTADTVTANTITADTVTAEAFVGDGSGLTGIGNVGVEQLDVAQEAATSEGITNGHIWQSFTPTVSGVLTQVEFRLTTPHGGTATLTIYEGQGEGGAVLSAQTVEIPDHSDTVKYAVAGQPSMTAGDQYTFAVVADNGNDFNRVTLHNSDPYAGGRADFGPNHDYRFWTYMHTAGQMGIGRIATANTLEVEGDASKSTAGDWLANSDRRIKTHIETVTNALDTLDRVRLVSFEYTDEYQARHAGVGEGRYLNVIAQEFAEVFPDHVKGSGELLPDGSEILQVDTYPLTIYSAAAIQELRADTIRQLAEKDAQIESLQDRTAQLEAMVNKLSSK